MQNDSEARALLKARGFDRFVLQHRPEQIPGMRWLCEIKEAWAPVVGGKARDYGFTALDAVLKALACGPVPTTGTAEE